MANTKIWFLPCSSCVLVLASLSRCTDSTSGSTKVISWSLDVLVGKWDGEGECICSYINIGFFLCIFGDIFEKVGIVLNKSYLFHSGLTNRSQAFFVCRRMT